MGQAGQVVQEAASPPRPKVLRGQNRPVLLLARLLHEDALRPGHRRDPLLLLRPPVDRQQGQHPQPGNLRSEQRRKHHPMPPLRQGLQVPETAGQLRLRKTDLPVRQSSDGVLRDIHEHLG